MVQALLGGIAMNFNQYQKEAYYAIQKHDNKKEEIMHWAIGLAEETGEALSAIKRKYYGGSYNIENAVEELGDVLWNLAALCTSLEIELDDIAEFNLMKLRYRYPNGDFDDERSRRRKELQQEEDWKELRKGFWSIR